MILSTRLVLVILTFLTTMWVATCGEAMAAVSLQNVEFAAIQGNQVQVDLVLSGAVEPPEAFSTESPSRIVVDLPGVTIGLDKNTVPIGVGVVHSVVAVAGGGFTRTVINLSESVPYDVRIRGNRVSITVAARSTQALRGGMSFDAPPSPRLEAAATPTAANPLDRRPSEDMNQYAERWAIREQSDASPSQGVGRVFLLALIAVGAATIPAVLLFKWIGVKGAASNAHQLGRKWLAWTVASLTLTVGTRFVAHNFDLNFLAQWAIGVVVFGGLAYALGWTYWKIVRERPWKRIANTMTRDADNRLYEIAWDEIQSDKMEKGLWARSFSQSAGNAEKARAIYVKERVKELQRSGAQ